MALARAVRSVAISAAVFLASWAAPVQAELITFEFEGVVTGFQNEAPVYFPDISIGAIFSGSYTFESTTPDVEPSPNVGLYGNAMTRLVYRIGADEIVFGSPEFPLEGSGINVGDDAGAGGEHYSAYGLSLLSDSILFFLLTLEDSNGNVFSSDALPLTPPDINQFDTRRVTLRAAPPELALFEFPQLFIEGELTSFRLADTEIPEPATPVLVAMGFLAAAFGRRRAAV